MQGQKIQHWYEYEVMQKRNFTRAVQTPKPVELHAQYVAAAKDKA